MDRKFVTISTIRNRIQEVLDTYTEQQHRVEQYVPYNSDDTSSSKNSSLSNSEKSFTDLVNHSVHSNEATSAFGYNSNSNGYRCTTNSNENYDDDDDDSDSDSNDAHLFDEEKCLNRPGQTCTHRIKIKPNRNLIKRRKKATSNDNNCTSENISMDLN